MEALLVWLESLPLWALYSSIALLALVENIFPPIPSDTIVAFGSFLAARGQGTALAAFVLTWGGNIAGAMIMYAAGRRFGAGWLERWLRVAHATEKNENRLESLYNRYGLAALAISRFIPGVRALVPPFAGALRLGAVRVFLALAVPSGIWYGAITWVAFQMGSRFDDTLASMKSAQSWTAIVAVALVLAAAAAYLIARRRRQPQ
jgi:membrane protein DedA with SNARE-associated domain